MHRIPAPGPDGPSRPESSAEPTPASAELRPGGVGSRSSTGFLRLLTAVVDGPAPHPPPRALSHGERGRALYLTGICTAGMLPPVYFGFNALRANGFSSLTFWGSAAAFAVALSTLAALRLGVRAQRAGTYYLGLTGLALMLVAVANGGANAPAVLWQLLLPVFASQLLSLRAGVLASALLLAQLVVFMVLCSYGLEYPREWPEEYYRNLHAQSLIFITLFFLGTTWLYHASIGEALRRMSAALVEREEAISSLERARDEAREASNSKSLLLANVSHELRTPLGAILGMTDLLLDSPLVHEQTEWARHVRRSAGNLMWMVDNLIELSGPGRGGVELQVSAFDAGAVARKACQGVAVEARAKGIDFQFHVDPALPRQLLGDGRQLELVICNLVHNAVKFTERGQVIARLRYHRASGGPAEVEVEVDDTGPGVPADLVPKLFEAFWQADATSKRLHGGAGIGLAVCRAIATRTGGSAGYAPLADGGSRFWARLLFLAGPSADTSAAEASPNQGAEVHRALVVEDNPVNSLLAVKLLERLGFECHTAESGHGALQRFSEVPYSVIFMDCQMPEMDGYEASAAIRGLASGGTVPIVAVTAHAVAEDRERCMAAGMSAYLSKPITLECLRQVLRQVGVPCSR